MLQDGNPYKTPMVVDSRAIHRSARGVTYLVGAIPMVDGLAALILSITRFSSSIYTTRFALWCLPLLIGCLAVGGVLMHLTRRFMFPRACCPLVLCALTLPILGIVVKSLFPTLLSNHVFSPSLQYLLPISQAFLVSGKNIEFRCGAIAIIDCLAFVIAYQLGRYYYFALV